MKPILGITFSFTLQMQQLMRQTAATANWRRLLLRQNLLKKSTKEGSITPYGQIFNHVLEADATSDATGELDNDILRSTLLNWLL